MRVKDQDAVNGHILWLRGFVPYNAAVRPGDSVLIARPSKTAPVTLDCKADIAYRTTFIQPDLSITSR